MNIKFLKEKDYDEANVSENIVEDDEISEVEVERVTDNANNVETPNEGEGHLKQKQNVDIEILKNGNLCKMFAY